MFLVIVDAHSKWPEVLNMSFTTTGGTIAVVRWVFAAYWLPQKLVKTMTHSLCQVSSPTSYKPME